MADQGKVTITMTVPESTAYGSAVSGAGTLSATLRAVGIMADSTAAGVTTGPVQIGGTALGIASGSVTAGAHLCATATGALVVQSTEADDLVCAIALEGASDGEMFKVKII